MGLTDLSRNSLAIILNCIKNDCEIIKKLRRTRFELNKLVIEIGLDKLVAEEVRLQKAHEARQVGLTITDFEVALHHLFGHIQNRLRDGVAPDQGELNEVLDDNIEMRQADIRGNGNPNDDGAEEMRREMLYVTIRKEHSMKRQNPQSWTIAMRENIESSREEVGSKDPFISVKHRNSTKAKRFGYSTREDGMPIRVSKTPHYIFKEASCADKAINREKVFEMLETAIKQIRSLAMLSIFDFTIDIDFVHRLKTVNYDLKKITRLNLQCIVDLAQAQFMDFLHIFSLESIFISCNFLQEIKLEECLRGLKGRIIIMDVRQNDTDPSAAMISSSLLNQWKLNPPRQIKIVPVLDWTFSQIWNFIKDIVYQKRPEHKKTTYYTFGKIKNTQEEWIPLARAKIQKGFTWKINTSQPYCQAYEISHKDIKVIFAFELLLYWRDMPMPPSLVRNYLSQM